PVAIWFLISKVTEYVSLASLLATFLSVVFSAFICDNYVTISLLMIWLLIVYKHKDNIGRLLKGTENKKNY
ncbi:MAG: glycerol-3-phosphate acyltransferase, partial [Erysipelotrichia bacterium]|nr:glycerol-3-phosphate acyltransferase [Erysipelotrichia bacterium]